MAYINYHFQGVSATFTSKLLPCTKVQLPKSHVINKRNTYASMKGGAIMSVDGCQVKISALERMPCHAEPRETKPHSKLPNLSVELPPAPQEAHKNETSQDEGPPFYFTDDAAASAYNHTKWIPQPTGYERIHEPPSVQTAGAAPDKDLYQCMWKSVSLLVGPYATVNIPILIFIPGLLAVSALHGLQVTYELMPLWVFGPLVAAVYVGVIRAICGLYCFCFRQAVRGAMSLPRYASMAYAYAKDGRLMNDMRVLLLRPVKTDYKALARRKMDGFKEGVRERYLDFIESIWPFYCRTIRFLKKASLL